MLESIGFRVASATLDNSESRVRDADSIKTDEFNSFVRSLTVINGSAYVLSVSKTNELEKEAQKEPEVATEEKKTLKKAAKKTQTGKKDEQLRFPVEGFLNKYSFLRISPAIQKALGWHVTGDRLKLSLDMQDGKLIVSKPSK